MNSPRPNFLIILTDQQRVDTLGCYGARVCQSPAVDDFARTAARFTQAYSVCALCTPARASMLTGQYPHRHGLIRNSEDWYCKTEFGPQDRLLSQDLSASGYACGLVGKWHCGIERLPRDFGFFGMNVPGYGKVHKTREYADYVRERGLDTGTIEPFGGGWHPNTVLAGRRTGDVEASVPYFVAEQTIQALKRQAAEDRPFLLFSNFWGPHAPYFPNEPYASMYDPRIIEPWGNFHETFADKPNAHRRYLEAFLGPGKRERSWDECATWAAAYYGFASQIDAQIGRVMGTLDELGLAGNTVVIFTADHGDLLGCHGGMHDKCSIMCQETYQIPFLVRVPDAQPGITVDQPITNMDITATVLDLAGVSVERTLDSRSVAPFCRGDSATREPDVMCEFNGHHYLYESRMVTDGRWKYVFNAPEIDELYDLENDPWETTNLAANRRHADILSHYQERLLAHAEESGDRLVPWLRNCHLPHRTDGFTPYGQNYRA